MAYVAIIDVDTGGQDIRGNGGTGAVIHVPIVSEARELARRLSEMVPAEGQPGLAFNLHPVTRCISDEGNWWYFYGQEYQMP